MAHFAKINNNNVVEQVIVIDNNDVNNLDFPESEAVGQAFIKSIGLEGKWLQTSYNAKFRKHYAGIGYTYDSIMDAFISSKSFASWIFDPATFAWKPPVEVPADLKMPVWNESTKKWQEYSN